MESIVEDIEIKCVPFGCHTGIIHNNIDMVILLLNQRNERVNALFVRNIELFNVDLGVGVFCQDFVLSFVRKFDISASHYNVPILAFSQVIDNTKSDTLVRPSYDNVFNLVHTKMLLEKIFIFYKIKDVKGF